MTPESTIRVRISSEEAGEITMTPVVVQELRLGELVEVLLSVCGSKDRGRIRDLLARGSAVQGASRFRWEPVDVELGVVDEMLGRFPDADPSRRFDPAQCFHVRLTGAQRRVEVARDVASARRWFKRKSYWDLLMETAARGQPEYVAYSYRERADVYRMVAPRALEEGVGLLKYSGLAQQIERAEVGWMELLTRRG